MVHGYACLSPIPSNQHSALAIKFVWIEREFLCLWPAWEGMFCWFCGVFIQMFMSLCMNQIFLKYVFFISESNKSILLYWQILLYIFSITSLNYVSYHSEYTREGIVLSHTLRKKLSALTLKQKTSKSLSRIVRKKIQDWRTTWLSKKEKLRTVSRTPWSNSNSEVSKS